jgi:hypothetical protein
MNDRMARKILVIHAHPDAGHGHFGTAPAAEPPV